jgi:hypothetical protein
MDNVGRVFRVVNKADLVPRNPPRALEYIHHVQEVWYTGVESDGKESFISCNHHTTLEDPECSLSLPIYSLRPFDHVHYFGFTFNSEACNKKN